MAAPHWTRCLQLTLAVIKPDAVAHPAISEAVHQKILSNNFIIVKSKELRWRSAESQNFYGEHTVKSKELRWRSAESQNFYGEHTGRFFYQRLVEFMSSGPMRAYILAHENAIQHWRNLMGPTKVFRARITAPETIRGNLGLTDTRNTTHGSDSVESTCREIPFFFPEFNLNYWYQEQEPRYRTGPLRYDEESLEHRVEG